MEYHVRMYMVHAISFILVIHTLKRSYKNSTPANLLQGVEWSGQWRSGNDGVRSD